MNKLRLYGNWIKGALAKRVLATLELTYRCNLRCKTCGVWKKTDDPLLKKESELSLDQICLLLDDLKAMGIEKINLIGAEPLMRKDLLEIVQEIQKRGLACEITTNGTMVTEDFALAAVEHGVDRINISLDAAGEDHDRIRGVNGTFERVRRSITLLREVRDRERKQHPRLTIHTCISRLNFGQLEKIVPIAIETGADLLRYAYLTATPKEPMANTTLDGISIGSTRFISNNGSLLLERTQIHILKQKLRLCQRAAENSPLQVRVGANLRRSEASLAQGTVNTTLCRTLRNRIIVNPVGEVYPCALLDQYAYGNVKHESIRAIWSGEKRMRLVHRVDKELFPICRYCGCHYASNLGVLKYVSALLRKY